MLSSVGMIRIDAREEVPMLNTKSRATAQREERAKGELTILYAHDGSVLIISPNCIDEIPTRTEQPTVNIRLPSSILDAIRSIPDVIRNAEASIMTAPMIGAGIFDSSLASGEMKIITRSIAEVTRPTLRDVATVADARPIWAEEIQVPMEPSIPEQSLLQPSARTLRLIFFMSGRTMSTSLTFWQVINPAILCSVATAAVTRKGTSIQSKCNSFMGITGKATTPPASATLRSSVPLSKAGLKPMSSRDKHRSLWGCHETAVFECATVREMVKRRQVSEALAVIEQSGCVIQ